jgi:hypothetical protein
MTMIQERCKESPADRSYDQTLKEISGLGPEGKELAGALDVTVGQRLAECQDAAVAEGMGGVIVDGTIMLDSGLQGWGVKVNIPHARALNPSFDDCKCYWGRRSWEVGLEDEAKLSTSREPMYYSIENGERLHGLLMDLDGDNPLDGVSNLLVHAADEPTPFDWEFASVVAQHNWRDPVTMADFGMYFGEIFDARKQTPTRLGS